MYYIGKKYYGHPNTEYYYTGLDDPELLYSNNFSDAETFESWDVCFLKYETMRAELDQKDNVNYYIYVESAEVNGLNEPT